MDPGRLQPAYDLVARQVSAGEVPAAVLAVADAERIIRAGAFSPGRERVTVRSRFMVASITKPILTTAVMQLVEAGALDLDRPVASYLPDFAPAGAGPGEVGGEQVTARHVLSHTAGLGEDWERMRRERPSARRVYAALCRDPLRFAPGTRFAYTSNSYFVLAELIGRLTGQPYGAILRERIFRPLGMGSTTFRMPAHDRAPVHAFGPNAMLRPLFLRAFMSLAHPGGGLWSAADDLVRFGQTILRGGEREGVRLLNARSVAEMTREQTTGLRDEAEPGRAPHYGLGWGLPGLDPDRPGTTAAVDHGGSTGSRLWVDPGAGLVIVYLANRWQSETRFSLAAIRAVYEALGFERSMGTATSEPHSVQEPS